MDCFPFQQCSVGKEDAVDYGQLFRPVLLEKFSQWAWGEMHIRLSEKQKANYAIYRLSGYLKAAMRKLC